MEITAIKEQVRNPNRVSIFVDGKYSLSLTLDQLLEQELKKGLELDDHRIKELKKLSDEGKQKMRALEWLLMRPHSTREFREYGYRKKIEKEVIEAWIDDFRDQKYLDDTAFANWFAENRARKNKSSRAIISELMSKGISKDVAEAALSELQDDAVSLQALVRKLRTKSRYQDDQKLTAHLLQKGFRYSDIREAMLEQ